MTADLLFESGPPFAVSVAFVSVFAAFVVAFVVLAIVTVSWAVRKDRVGRAQWVRRRQEERIARGGVVPPPVTNGRRPAKDPGDSERRSK